LPTYCEHPFWSSRSTDLEAGAKNPATVLRISLLLGAIIRNCRREGHPGRGNTYVAGATVVLYSEATNEKNVYYQTLRSLSAQFTKRNRQSRPSTHAGLDYFKLLSLLRYDDPERKCYGCIITCAVMRLIHLNYFGVSSRDLCFSFLLLAIILRYSRLGKLFFKDADGLSEMTSHQKRDSKLGNSVEAYDYACCTARGAYERLIKPVKRLPYKSLSDAEFCYRLLSTRHRDNHRYQIAYIRGTRLTGLQSSLLTGNAGQLEALGYNKKKKAAKFTIFKRGTRNNLPLREPRREHRYGGRPIELIQLLAIYA
ncbi:hypothetical protein COOONC_28011, partial [Cooperia oncophora]